LGTALIWRIGWLTASRWSAKARVAARAIDNLLPVPAADPFVAIAAIILIAAMSAVRIVRRYERGEMPPSAWARATAPRPALTLPVSTGPMNVNG
jgi:hypothetical protein